VGEFDYGSRFEVDDLDDVPQIADIASRLYLLAMSATDVGPAPPSHRRYFGYKQPADWRYESPMRVSRRIGKPLAKPLKPHW
jgi:hypothetical protein